MKQSIFIVIIIILVSCSANKEVHLVERENTSQPLLIKGVDIFNGRDNQIIQDQDILIKNGVITSISSKINSSDTYREIDGTGKTIMPGLVDSHIHLSGSGAVPWANVKPDINYNLQAYLYAGITTVYDLGGLAGELNKVAKKVENGELVGPDIYHTHIPITVKNSHPIPLTEVMLPWPLKSMVNGISPTIDKVTDAPKLIQKYVANNIDYVKIVCDQIPPGSPEMSLEQLKALIEEAHKVGKTVFVHIGSPENVINAIKAGADVLAHGVWRGKLSEKQADFIANSKVPIIYTLSGFKNVGHIHGGQFSPTAMDKKLIPKAVLDPVTMEKGKAVHNQVVMKDFFKHVSKQSEHWKNNFGMLHTRGANILIGTDSNLPGTYAGATYFQELNELSKYGMSNFEILTGATFGNSKLFLDHPDFGIVAEGKKANLLLLNGNPLENLEVVKNPVMILKRGEMIKRVK